MDSGARSRPLVLIADNDRGVNSMLGEVLQQRGLDVRSATDGCRALEMLRAGGIDLLVCDLDMPGLSGEDLLAEVSGWPEAPVVFVISGYLDPDLTARLRALAPVRRVDSKPFDVFAFADDVAATARSLGEREPPASSRGTLFDTDLSN